MAIAAKSCLSKEKPVSSPAMDTIGLIRAAANLRSQSAILDGEAIVQNGNGASDFEALSSALQRQPNSIILYAFDLLWSR